MYTENDREWSVGTEVHADMASLRATSIGWVERVGGRFGWKGWVEGVGGKGGWKGWVEGVHVWVQVLID